MLNEISRHSRYGGVFSLIILDLDSFKVVNDSYGHLTGDDILAKIGNVVRDSIRGADMAFRYGGDEFAVLLPNTGTDAANKVAERIRKRITAKVKCHRIPITTSLGLATWPTNGAIADELIASADGALYEAKRSGGNRTNQSET
jgi:diguanylate cyclase (GGDEF)-like protein